MMKNIFSPWKEREPTALKCYYVIEYENRANLVRRKHAEDSDIYLDHKEIFCEDVTKQGANRNCYQAPGRDPWSHFCKGIAAILRSGPGVKAFGADTAENRREPIKSEEQMKIYCLHCPPSHLLSIGQVYQGQGIARGSRN